MRSLPNTLIFLLSVGVLWSEAGAVVCADEPASLRILRDEYPRAFFFRSSEGLAANGRISYRQWDACFSRLMGIEGKVLDEEVPGRSLRNVDFFTRFKREHPDQLVLLHYNGNARDPRFQTEQFFAGHWLYCNGAKILQNVPAQDGEIEISVDNPRLFRVDTGRYRNANEDVGLCTLDANGRPDWHQSEQVQLLAVNVPRKTIRVRRGCYGTKPRALPAGRAYAAAHLSEGPWGRRSNLLWYYNYSTRCPRDNQGRTCADVHAADLAARFAPVGELAAFDGLEFDVLHHEVGGGRSRLRGADCDADGRPDYGVFDGVNQYGIGVIEFCRQLREKMGPQKIIQADGASPRNQRAFRILNGIESEGFPHLSDWEMRDFSGGLNRHMFWQRRARPPVLNYINHKFMTSGPKPGDRVRPKVPFAVHRLAMAAAMFTDAAVCYSFTPPAEEGEMLGIWDELRKGTENELGWLGRPLGPPVRLAQQQPDLLHAAGNPITAALLERLSGDGLTFELDANRLKVTAAGKGRRELRFHLRDVPCRGPDLFVSLTARGLPMRGYPPEAARLISVGIVTPALPPVDRPGAAPAPPARLMSWLDDRDFHSGFYFSQVQSPKIDLELVIEGSEPVWISSLTAHAHPDAIYRHFQHGLVLANPSPRPYELNLGRLLPGHTFRRLRGSSKQDPTANDGSPVPDKLTLAPREGLFLVEQ